MFRRSAWNYFWHQFDHFPLDPMTLWCHNSLQKLPSKRRIYGGSVDGWEKQQGQAAGLRHEGITKSLYGTTYYNLDSWLRCCTDLRNICAHYGRLYYRIFFAIPATPDGFPIRLGRRLFDNIEMLSFLYPDRDKWNNEGLLSTIALIDEYSEDIELRHIGFPINWEKLLYKAWLLSFVAHKCTCGTSCSLIGSKILSASPVAVRINRTQGGQCPDPVQVSVFSKEKSKFSKVFGAFFGSRLSLSSVWTVVCCFFSLM